jgi:hypothetical protein
VVFFIKSNKKAKFFFEALFESANLFPTNQRLGINAYWGMAGQARNDTEGLPLV